LHQEEKVFSPFGEVKPILNSSQRGKEILASYSKDQTPDDAGVVFID